MTFAPSCEDDRRTIVDILEPKNSTEAQLCGVLGLTICVALWSALDLGQGRDG